MLEKIRQNDLIKLVEKYGEDFVSKELKVPVKVIRDRIIELYGEHDFEYYAQYRLFVEDDTKSENKIVPFMLNSAQKKLNRAIEEQRKQGKPIRLIHLKPRQYGASTYFEGYIYRDVSTRKNRHATTISYVLESATHLRDIAGRFYDRYPGGKPLLKGRSDKTWKFPQLDSTWRIDSAENLQAGHSFTNQILHISELSRWERDVSTLMRGLTSSVQAIPDTMIIVESTANGYGDYFHELWERAKRGSGYTAVFVAWYEVEKYKMPFYAGKTYDNKDSREAFEHGLSNYEKSLVDTHGVSMEQLHWRRWKIEEDLKGDEDSFFEQYPATDEEAFLASGRPYFPSVLVKENLIRSKKTSFKIGNLEWRDGGKRVEFDEDRDGQWKVLELPAEGWRYRYVTGSDPAEGISATDDNKDPDFSVCTVFDRVTKKEVARFRARVHTDVFEEEIYKAVKFYDSACDCVETNNTAGGAVIKGLKDREGINLYVRELQGKTEDKETKEYGFRTDKATREILLSEFRLRLKTCKYLSEDEQLWKECQTFVIGKDGKPKAQYGAHDDVVLSGALTVEADNQASEAMPIERPQEKIVYAPDAYLSYGNEEESHSVYAEF